MATSASKKSSASRKTSSKPKPSALTAQYQAALLSEPETTTTTTTQSKTTSRVISSAKATPSPAMAAETPVTRLASPKLLKTATPQPTAVKTVTTTVKTEVSTPATSKGALERLRGLGYEPLLELTSNVGGTSKVGGTSGDRLEAIYAASPLGEKVLVRTSSRPKHSRGDKTFTVEAAEDSVANNSVHEFFAKELILDANLGVRIDTDFAILTPIGLMVCLSDHTVHANWLYAESEEVAVANITKIREGWFVVASVDLDTLKEPASAENTIVDRLYEPPVDPDTDESIASFDILIQLLRMTGLLEVLRSGGPFTLLAPTDAAFAKLSEGTARDITLFASRNKLASILEYHIYPGKLTSKNIGDTDTPTVQGEIIEWDKTGNPVTAGNANVLYVDLEASNGVIHVVDRVLMPKSTDSPTLKTMMEPVDLDDVDYTTQRIRSALAKFNDRRGLSLAENKEKLDDALVELQQARSRISSDIQTALTKTKRYNDIAEDPTREDAALKLVGEISLENDAIDANIAKQNEVNDILMEIETITARIKALAVSLKKNSRAAKEIQA